MYQSNKEALQEVLSGVGVICLFLGLCTGLVVLFSYLTEPEVAPSETHFKVVDNYKGCEVVRWGNGRQAEYKYLLYCERP